jgi:predicted enzyme related to lactoylglutathione lyase
VEAQEEDMSGSVVWFTLTARDPDALRRFYEALLSREVEEARLTSTDTGVSGAFRLIRSGGIPGSTSEEDERGVVLSFEVDDLDAALGRARALGAVGHTGDRVEGLDGADRRFRTAWMHDPGGNRLALVSRAG